MKSNKIICLVAALFCMNLATAAEGKWVTYQFDLKTSHPHESYMDETIPMKFAGAKKVKLHFEYLDFYAELDSDGVTQTYCDSITLPTQKLEGVQAQPFWTDEISADEFEMKIHTCYNGHGAKGFVIDQVAVQF